MPAGRYYAVRWFVPAEAGVDEGGTVSRSDAPSSLSRRLSRRASIAVLAGTGVAALLAGAGCSAGQIAETAKVKPAVQGVNVDVGPIALRDLSVYYPGSGSYAAQDNAKLLVRIVNTGGQADTLTSVTTDAAGSVTLAGGSASPSASASGTPSTTPSGTPSATPSASPSAVGSSKITVPLPPRQLVQLVPGGTRQYLVVNNLKSALAPGQALRLVFTFATAGSVTVDVPMNMPNQVTERPSASDIEETGGA